jgi:hypothetical protein
LAVGCCKLATLGRLANPGRVPAEAFLSFAPSVPQAFARLWGTIQRGSATGLYVEGSKVWPVEDGGQSFPEPSQGEGKQWVTQDWAAGPLSP